MAKTDSITPEMLREVLGYNPNTGTLHWKNRPISMFGNDRLCNSWNSRHAGKEAFTTSQTHGYLKSSVMDIELLAHRVAWAIYHGVWPVNDIDHRNGNKRDNRINNLREANKTENLQNRGKQSNNTSGYKCVSFDKRRNSWFSYINADGKRKYLGCYPTPEEAHAAYCEAAKKYHGEFARTE